MGLIDAHVIKLEAALKLLVYQLGMRAVQGRQRHTCAEKGKLYILLLL